MSLKSGRYRVIAKDESLNAGLLAEELQRSPVAVTGVKFQGNRLVTLNLTPGTWVFFATYGRPIEVSVTPN